MFRGIHSEETKKKMSISAKKRGGQPHSLETRKKMSESRKKWSFSDETKKNWSKSRKGKTFSEEHRRNWIKSHVWETPSDETKRKLSDSLIKKWKDPEFAKMMLLSQCRFPNKPETFLMNFLEGLYPGEWKYVGDGQFCIAGKCPDFINVNGQKKIIELFGDYWHRDQDSKDRADIFKPFGFETLVIWEKELKNIKTLRRAIFNFAEQNHKE